MQAPKGHMDLTGDQGVQFDGPKPGGDIAAAGSGADSPVGGGGDVGGGGLKGGGGCGGEQALRAPDGVYRGLADCLARAVANHEWRPALLSIIHMLEAAGLEHTNEPYKVSVRRVVGGWQAVVELNAIGIIATGAVDTTAAGAIDGAVFQAFASLFDMVRSKWAAQ